MTLKDIGEIELIKRLSRQFKCDKSVIKGIGDDAAVIKWTKDRCLLFGCDMIVEDVHFKLKSAAPYQIGWKALGRNISDIAAMGGEPRYALVSIGIDAHASESFLNEICRGIMDLARKFDINIVGGDTSKSEKLVIDISMIGEVERDKITLRSQAKTGDAVLVTGAIGGSYIGRHLNFMPRLAEARQLVGNFKINSMIDMSDGLILDLWRILDASKVGARIYQDAIPISKEADSFKKAIVEGEDFELLFTMSPKEAKALLKKGLKNTKTPVTLIGQITDRRDGYRLIAAGGKGRTLKAKGYLHF